MEASLARRYEEQLSKDPNSRIFAQLGEVYRKMGMLDRAVQIFREGIRRHPDYILGHLGLAFCYVDMEQIQLAYACLSPLVEGARDNIRLQKLYAKCCEELGYKNEALETWKYLLFISPRDREYMAKVKFLEATVEEFSAPDRAAHEFSIENLKPVPSDDVDDWIRVDLAVDKEVRASDEISDAQVSDNFEQINLVDANEEEEEAHENHEAPIVSLTLVDLYLAQGHQERALEVLHKMQELNPGDERVKAKLATLTQSSQPDAVDASEDDGHARLLQMVEARQSSFADEEEIQIEEDAPVIDDAGMGHVVAKLDGFLQQIKQRAAEKTTQA